ncbi:hypothetical protein EGW08_009535 [Elysia chlorotica]|uniref:Peptidase M12B domain-containing protein n=1 Tax=Elysia chlorotica TaxID=188477 RepID=A0A433TMC5_ELYCH|nr:hypothetical protein EGW08_009535 [Elysia chlorotica]
MATSQLTLLAVLSLAVMAQGEKVILKVEHPELNGNSQCILPPTLTVKIERQDGGREIPELFLSQSGVAPPSSHVKIMQVDPQGSIRLDHHEIHEPKVLQSQAYHNHSIGASCIVSCVLSDIEKMYFRLEGSIYVDSSKYRLTPEILDEEDDSIQFEFEHVAVMYSMTPVLELSSYNCGVQYHGSDVDTSSGKVIYPGKADAIEYPFSSSSSRIKDSDTDDLGVSNLHRHRRDSNTNAVYYVDILPVIDYSTYSLWYDRNPNEDEVKKMLNTYLINTLSAVEMRLQTLQLGGTKLRVKMVSPIISTDPSTSPFTEDIKVSVNGSLKVIAPQLLSTFSQWVENNRDSLPPNDHMMLFTSYDLIPNNITDGTASSIIKGLAKVGALCTNGSVSLIEDKGAYQSENVAAHELGHSLGSNHDGDDNACKPADRYMMSPKTFPQKDSNLLHPWQFSTCSSDAIAAYIKSLEASDIPRISCLLKQLGVNVSNELSLTAHEICKMSYGNTAFPCMYPTNFSEICTKLSCRTIENPMCTLMVPPTGTCCGNGKSCLAGLCVDDDSQGKCVVDGKR